MEHSEIIVDSGSKFIIDPQTRNIQREDKTPLVLVQGDHNSERVTFTIPRYVDGHDMSSCGRVEIHYINTDTKGNKSEDVYIVGDLKAENENEVSFTWLIAKPATVYAGTLVFLIRFLCFGEDNSIVYALNTNMFKSIVVGEGCDCNPAEDKKYEDMFQSWANSVIKTVNETVETNCKIQGTKVTERCKKLLPGETFELKRGMTGTIHAVDHDMSLHTKDGDTVLSGMDLTFFRHEEIGEYVENQGVYTVTYPFGENAKCTTVSGGEAGLYGTDDVLRLEGGTNGGYLGGFAHGAVADKTVTVKFDLYMSKRDQFRFAPTSFDTFPDNKRVGLDITDTGQINKLEVTKASNGDSMWESMQYIAEPIIFPLNEWHEFTLVYDNVNGNVDVYMDGSILFGWTGVKMPKGAPKDFAFHGTVNKATYMNNIKMYVGDANDETNLVCSYMDKPMYVEYRVSFTYKGTPTLTNAVGMFSHHHRYPEGLYLKNNNSSGNAYIYYTDKGVD